MTVLAKVMHQWDKAPPRVRRILELMGPLEGIKEDMRRALLSCSVTRGDLAWQEFAGWCIMHYGELACKPVSLAMSLANEGARLEMEPPPTGIPGDELDKRLMRWLMNDDNAARLNHALTLEKEKYENTSGV